MDHSAGAMPCRNLSYGEKMADDDIPKPRRSFRFSLRTLLVVILLSCSLFGVLGWMAREASRQRKVVADLREEFAHVVFSEKESWAPDYVDTGYLHRVAEIRVYNQEFSDVTPLGEMKNLRWLELFTTQVSDVTPLEGLENLRVLYLPHATRVSDISPLARMKNLELLYLPKASVTDEQVNHLQRVLPNCDIVR